jgi:hypothetical protein
MNQSSITWAIISLTETGVTMLNVQEELIEQKSSDYYLIRMPNTTAIIDYQYQILSDEAVSGLLPIAIVYGGDTLKLSANLGSSNRLSDIDKSKEGCEQTGLLRLKQFAELMMKAEEYLFLPGQCVLNNNTLRLQEIDDLASDKSDINGENTYQPQLLVIPCKPMNEDDNNVISGLIEPISAFYDISTEISCRMIENYKSEGLSGLLKSIELAPDQEKLAGNETDVSSKKNKYDFRLLLNTVVIAIWIIAAMITLFFSINDTKLSGSMSRQTMLTILAISGLVILANHIATTIKNIEFKAIISKFENVLWLKKSKDNQTVLLNQNNDNYGIAILSEGLPGTPQENEGLRAFILLDEFIIGRDESQADLYLDDKTIGRKHARITRREGEFFLTDLGSKNGTRIDGRKINKNEDIMLPDRCRLHFADRAFFFQNEEPL